MANFFILFLNNPRPYFNVTDYTANRSEQNSSLKDYHDFGYATCSLASLTVNEKSL